MRTRWAVVVMGFAFGCHDSDGRLRPDASVSIDASPMPIACTAGGTMPALPEVCFANGWCLDAPAPLGWATTSLADGNELWFAALGHLIHYDGALATPYSVPLGVNPHLVGGGSAGVWAHSDQAMWRFDGGQWVEISVPGYVNKLVPVGPERAWAMISGQLHHYNGAWSAVSLPSGLRTNATYGVQFNAMGAHDDDAWLSVTLLNFETYEMSHILAHLVGTTWELQDLPDRITEIVPLSRTNVWLAGSAIFHHDGTQTIRVHELYGANIRARSPNDVWAFSQDTVAHWDGVTWTACASSVTSLAPRANGDVWGTRTDGALVHYNGSQWSETRALPELHDLEAFTAQDVMALGGSDAQGSGVVLRRTAGGWQADATFPGTAWGRLVSRGATDVWAVGPSAVHYDGNGWTDTQPPNLVRDLCQSDGNTALAIGNGGVHAFDGSAWSQDASFGGGSIFCMPGGEAFATLDASYQIAHRVNGSWSVSPTDDGLARTYSPAPGVLWSAGNSPPKRSAGMQWEEATRGLTPFINTSVNNDYMDVTGTSPTDIYVLVNDDRIVRHDGTSYVSMTNVTGIRQIVALAPADLLLLKADFTTQRLVNGTVTTIAPAISGDNVFFSAPVWFASPTSGFAISDTGHVMRFNGTWARDTTFPGTFASGLVAFSATDIWTIANGNSVAHFNGSTWTASALPGAVAGSPAVGIWGSSTTDLWVGALDGKLWRVVNGTPSAFAHGLGSDRPTEIGVIAGTAANDVWFSGRYLHQSTYTQTLFHWNGSTFTRYRSPDLLTQFTQSGSNEVLALGWDSIGVPASVWQYTSNGWIVRSDLDEATVFGTLPLAARPPIYGGIVERPTTKPYWSTGGVAYPVEHGGLIWRQD